MIAVRKRKKNSQMKISMNIPRSMKGSAASLLMEISNANINIVARKKVLESYAVGF
jgi:hypothetical protein